MEIEVLSITDPGTRGNSIRNFTVDMVTMYKFLDPVIVKIKMHENLITEPEPEH